MTDHDKQILLTLANLIERGSVDMRQITGRFGDGNGVCAIGAACNASHVLQTPFPDLALRDHLGITEWPLVQYPSGVPCLKWIYDVNKPMPLDNAIIGLNDVGGWSFEAIVMWLRSMAQND